MNLTNANEILQTLVKNGIVSEDELKRAIQSSPTNDMKRIVDLIHGVFCVAEHSMDGCCYYLEENELRPWEETEHQVWLLLTIDMMQELNIETENEFLDCFRAAKKVKEEIQSLTTPAQDLLQRLLKIP